MYSILSHTNSAIELHPSYHIYKINPLPDNETYDWSKLKKIAINILKRI